MTTYRQYCPVARASEILAERWSLLVVRNLLFGADTFSSIARGVPTMSRSVLAKRLRELEQHGIVEVTPKVKGQGHTYALTPAGAELVSVIDSLGQWAERWVDVLPDHADPAFALWAWCQVQLDRAALPDERVVVRFEFPEERSGNRHFWLLVDQGDAEVCYSDPGDEPRVVVIARSKPFVDWHRGALEWSSAVRRGDIEISGERSLVRRFPSWNLRRPVLA